jgi:hypothetical protein
MIKSQEFMAILSRTEYSMKSLEGETASTSSYPLPSTHNLDVIQINSVSEIQEIAKTTILSWQLQAEALWKSAEEQGLPETQKYADAFEVSKDLLEDFQNPCISRQEYLVCKDKRGQLQGCMDLSEFTRSGIHRSITINFLMTRPENIRSKLIDLADKVSGAGSILVRAAEVVCIKKQFDEVYLYPSKSSVGFYKKLKYVVIAGDMGHLLKRRTSMS